MSRFLIIIEQGSNNYSAYVPDLPGCIATGRTLEEVKANMEQAIKLHIEGMMEDREPLPVSHSIAEYLDIPVPGSAA
ncbi:MAG TPA: type II toxin-antitoxin system HicB family antitoxin [Ktedonosporobacter sp.]|jgi:predicted RNase H-like HicB family nuclease|nr:type II toxin-antitoxin system HicB family antitoxin [Ktedonosporobacter sp.]HZO75097.1 type II toxin-antitoxin system HicB family antitoxin [Ktedonobacteraceae bacterium]